MHKLIGSRMGRGLLCGKVEGMLIVLVHIPNFGVSGLDDRGGGDNSIQFIKFGRMEGWVTTIF